MRVLVTGHKGYIGTAMVPMLLSEGFDVVGLDSDLYRNSTWGNQPQAVNEIIKDVRDIEESDIEGFDAIIHLAALSNDVLGDLNEELTYEINYRASVRLAELARKCGVKRFIFASSCSSYGASGDQMLTESAVLNPVTAYAISKVRVERDLQDLATDQFSPVFMRNATAYGVSPRMRFDVVVNNLTAWAYTTGSVHMKSDGSPWRPVVHIEDITLACVAALRSPRETIHNQAFNVGRTSENYRVREIAEIVKATVPNCEISYADGAEPDKRNYRVSFEKYEKAFPHYALRWDVPTGTRSIYDSYRQVGLGKDDYEGPQFKRIAQLKKLLGSGQLDESLRWRAS